MEAQYALQKKKVLVPLMLTQGYEPDGWLGLLLGTSMWYAFYGDTLSSSSSFEARMDALCREVGDRGRADAMVVAATAPSPSARLTNAHTVTSNTEGNAAESEVSGLRLELQELKLMELRTRALSVGVTEERVEDATESVTPKAALIDLILDAEARRAPADRVRSCLEAGGEACAEMMTGILEHVMDVLEGLSVSSPRKDRRPLRELVDRLEVMLEKQIDAAWCDGVTCCGAESSGISERFVAAEALSSATAVAEAATVVGELLECIDRCTTEGRQVQ
jgi:hypothetical protein